MEFGHFLSYVSSLCISILRVCVCERERERMREGN